MEFFSTFMELFKSGDTVSKGVMIWGGLVGLMASLRTLLIIVAPMTKTKMDDKLAGIFTKMYNFSAKMTDHKTK